MSDKYVDPSGDTEAFRAFANDPQAPSASGPSKLPVIIGAVVVAVLLVLLAAWFLLG
ncbi:hypothetical protein V6U90_07120 [Micromonospora sp. CPCC 206060]|uniref:hypothetical protein n=1 Tax=Micromonospora sp. CPCC 206060 TaxID=3122406 RepID=UPI002FF1C2CD